MPRFIVHRVAHSVFYRSQPLGEGGTELFKRVRSPALLAFCVEVYESFHGGFHRFH